MGENDLDSNLFIQDENGNTIKLSEIHELDIELSVEKDEEMEDNELFIKNPPEMVGTFSGSVGIATDTEENMKIVDGIHSGVDFSYMQYLDGSCGRVLGRRIQAIELAKRNHADFEKYTHSGKMVAYQEAYFSILFEESRRIFCNNYRKMHGLPMRRKKRK